MLVNPILPTARCGYAASDESGAGSIAAAAEEELSLEKAATPAINTIDALVDFLNVPIEKTIKAVAYPGQATDRLVLALFVGIMMSMRSRLSIRSQGRWNCAWPKKRQSERLAGTRDS